MDQNTKPSNQNLLHADYENTQNRRRVYTEIYLDLDLCEIKDKEKSETGAAFSGK